MGHEHCHELMVCLLAVGAHSSGGRNTNPAYFPAHHRCSNEREEKIKNDDNFFFNKKYTKKLLLFHRIERKKKKGKHNKNFKMNLSLCLRHLPHKKIDAEKRPPHPLHHPPTESSIVFYKKKPHSKRVCTFSPPQNLIAIFFLAFFFRQQSGGHASLLRVRIAGGRTLAGVCLMRGRSRKPLRGSQEGARYQR